MKRDKKKNKPDYSRQQKFTFHVSVEEDWYPTVDDKVKLTCTIYQPNLQIREEFHHHISVWGGDDFGMEQSFKTAGEALSMYEHIADQEFITKQELRDLGFEQC